MSENGLEQMRRYLPHWLNAEQKKDLYAALGRYPDIDYYATFPDPSMLQGDAWRPFVLLDFDSGERRQVAGVVVSNSCDIALENNPDNDQCVLFSPLLNLQTIAGRLQTAGKTEKQIADTLSAIRRQEKADFLYFPSPGGSFPETIARLDHIQPQPLRTFAGIDRSRLFRLSQAGFCLFLIKLAIHFTRIQERVDRATQQ